MTLDKPPDQTDPGILPPRIAQEDLPPTEYLIMETLAARHRLGENHWTFPSKLAPHLSSLAKRGLIVRKSATIYGYQVAWLTGAGRACCLSETYKPPLPGNLTLDGLLIAVETIDAFLDSHRSPEYLEQPLANDWARVTKVCEEAGEVWKTLSKRTGENYRKGVCATEDELLGELGDCVSAAMCGIQHRTKDTAKTWAVVSAAFRKASQRVADFGEVPADAG